MIAWENPDYDYRDRQDVPVQGPAEGELTDAAMSVLVLYAHPVETSFNAALHRTIVERLDGQGHTVDDCDLYAEDFDPRLTRAERLDYHDYRGQHRQRCARYVERLLPADALVLVVSGLELRLPGDPEGLFRPRLPARRVVRAGRRQGEDRRCTTSARSRPSPPMAAAGSARC